MRGPEGCRKCDVAEIQKNENKIVDTPLCEFLQGFDK